MTCSRSCIHTHADVLDVNECLKNNGGCDSKRKCTNTAGSRTCGNCPAGFFNDGATGCKGLRQFGIDACETVFVQENKMCWVVNATLI